MLAQAPMDKDNGSKAQNEQDTGQERALDYKIRSRSDPAITLVDRAKEIETAEASIQTQVHGKLDLIVKQIRQLKEEAKRIMQEAEEDLELHRVRCGFEKKVGQSVYLYQKPGGERYFSMLSPEDWNGAPPSEYLGRYRVKPDMGFERVQAEAEDAGARVADAKEVN